MWASTDKLLYYKWVIMRSVINVLGNAENVFKLIENNLRRVISNVIESIVAIVVNEGNCINSDVSVTEERIATGFYIDKDVIITVSHILSNFKDRLCIISLDGDIYKGTVISVDEDNDLMFIGVDVSRRPLKIEDTLISEGAIVFSSGIAQGILRHFITMGIVSGLEVRSIINNREIEGLMLLNMPTIPGMSGAPLLNIDSNVVGMLLSRSFSYNEFSLALPSSRIFLSYLILRKLGKVVHIKLGLKLLQSPNALKKLKLENGLMIMGIANKLLFKNCNISVGDIIIEVNGKKINTLEDFRKAIALSILDNMSIELILFSQKEGLKRCHADISSAHLY
jgi:S1-C subfamily serine protease